MPQCMGALFPYQMNIARTDIPAAAWNNPSWLSNKKDSQTQRMKSCQVAKTLPTRKKIPSFVLEEDEKKERQLSS